MTNQASCLRSKPLKRINIEDNAAYTFEGKGIASEKRTAIFRSSKLSDTVESGTTVVPLFGNRSNVRAHPPRRRLNATAESLTHCLLEKSSFSGRCGRASTVKRIIGDIGPSWQVNRRLRWAATRVGGQSRYFSALDSFVPLLPPRLPTCLLLSQRKNLLFGSALLCCTQKAAAFRMNYSWNMLMQF